MSKDCQRPHGDSVRTQLFWVREDLVKAQTEIQRLTSESRTHKARADLNFDENERLRADSARLDWVLRNVSGAEWRRLGFAYADGMDRNHVDLGMYSDEVAKQSSAGDQHE